MDGKTTAELLAEIEGLRRRVAQLEGAAAEQMGHALRAVIHASPLAILALDSELNVTMWNPAAERMFGWAEQEVLGRPYPLVPQERVAEFRRRRDMIFSGEAFSGFETRRQRRDGSQIDVSISVAPLRDAGGNLWGIVVLIADISERKRAELLLAAEKRVLELIAQGTAPSMVLDLVARLIEEHVPEALASILLLDRDGARLRFASGPRLPEAFARAVDGLSVGPQAGSHGTAAHSKDAVLVPDIAADARWFPLRSLASSHGFRAAWSMPVVSAGGRVLGIFCLYYREPRSPGAEDRRLLEMGAHVTRIAVEHARAEEERTVWLAREQEARREAEMANRAKDEFLAMLGHELRNPLGAISSAVTALNRISSQREDAVRLRAIIARQTQHLARLVDDLLDVSRLTSGKITLERRPVDLREMAAHALNTLRLGGEADQHTITLAGDPVTVSGDPTRLEQIVWNLLHNALKYTPPGGEIGLTVERDGAEAVLRVRDTGMGIPPELLPRVFGLFVQGDQSLDRPQHGLGLGLALVKRLAELHQGAVAAFSEGPGRGSEFVVRMPVLVAAQAERPAQEANPPPVSRRIVIVEDHQDARDSLRILLEAWGHRVDEAAEGRGGLEKVLALRPDVALVDVGLPGLDGYALARAVREAPGGQAIYLVALTGYGQPEDRRRAQAAGFNAHLVKPVDGKELLDILGRTPGTAAGDGQQ